MPMYEYKCDSCGHPFERYSAGRSGQDTPGLCPKCGKSAVKRIFSTFASTCFGSSQGPGGSGGCGGGSSHFS